MYMTHTLSEDKLRRTHYSNRSATSRGEEALLS